MESALTRAIDSLEKGQPPEVLNLTAAMRYALESDRLPLGLIYHEPREHAAPQAAPTAFDTTSYLARYKA